MKKIKNLLLPIAAVTTSAAIVTPLVTSCGSKSVAYAEIPMDYKPSIAKHAELKATSPETAIAEYIKDIKKNPNIMSEDFKYSVGQVYSMVDELIEGKLKGSEGAPEIEVKVNSLKAGLNGLTFNDDGLFSYNCGVKASAEAKIDLSKYIEEETGVKTQCHIYAEVNNFGYEASFVNFDTFDISQETSILDYGYTAVKPVFPLDLTRDDWYVNVKTTGQMFVTLNDEVIVDADNLAIDMTFDCQNILACLIAFSGDITVMDFLQEIGSFASWYMSDVHFTNRITLKNNGIVDVKNIGETNGGSGATWIGTAKLNNPRRYDPEDLVITSSPRSVSEWSGTLTEGETKDELIAEININDDMMELPTYLAKNEMYFGIAKWRQDTKTLEDGNTHEWRERNTFYPRFNQGMQPDTQSTPTGLLTSLNDFYNKGSLCRYHISLESTGPAIKTGSTFVIVQDKSTPSATSDKMSFNNVVITVDGTALTKDTDYSISKNSITFLKDIAAPTGTTSKEIAIDLVCGETIKTGYMALGYLQLVA